jgi:hypothetical protein
MQMPSIKKISLVFLALLVAIAWVAWRAQQPNVTGTYKPGDSFPAPQGSGYSSTEHMVLFIDSRCPFCQASVPLYRKFFGVTVPEARRRLPVVVVGWEELSRIQGFVTDNDLRPSEVLSLDRLSQYAFRYSPTLLRVSSEGSVRDVWIGRMSKDQEQRLLTMTTAEN